jgi:GT2 family glycosyltransferase
MTAPTVGVVVLTWQAEPYLAECLSSVLQSTGVDVRVVLVDNGCRPEDLAAVELGDRIELLTPGTNTGFAGGCNLGAEKLDTDYVALVNSDCVLRPDTLAQLVAEAAHPHNGPVMAGIRLAEPPHLINSAGNPVHLVGLSWAGEMNSPETRQVPFEVTGASGACMLVRRKLWTELDGFDEAYFAYLEDTELSLRAWRKGLAVRCVPTAVVLHHYEFSRNAHKMYLLERNRLMMLATLWSTRALLLLAPLLVLTEVLLAAYALAAGWGRQKAQGWGWLWRNRTQIVRRRRELEAERREPHAVWMRRLTPVLDPRAIGPAPVTRLANLFFRGYWAIVRRLL